MMFTECSIAHAFWTTQLVRQQFKVLQAETVKAKPLCAFSARRGKTARLQFKCKCRTSKTDVRGVSPRPPPARCPAARRFAAAYSPPPLLPTFVMPSSEAISFCSKVRVAAHACSSAVERVSRSSLAVAVAQSERVAARWGATASQKRSPSCCCTCTVTQLKFWRR